MHKTTNSSTSSAKSIVTKLLALADIQVNGNRPWDIHVLNEAWYSRILRDGSLGLGETYVEEWWEAEAIDQLIYKMLRADIQRHIKLPYRQLLPIMKDKIFNLQTKTKSMEVINCHYQLGNDLFQIMLDPLMTYSCGYWKNATNLAEAQKAKYDLIARKLGFQKGMRVLDIGCGWGGFAKHVAETYGVTVVGITLSEKQAIFAREVTRGLPVEIRIQDYRNVSETFDRVIEIGMFEHVGGKNYRTFMEMVHRSLTDDGLFMLHTIGVNKTGPKDLWSHKYIFPNAQCPTIAEIGQSIDNLLYMEDWHNFGEDYDKTAMAWFSNFHKGWPSLKSQYSPTFYRMWKYYLLRGAGCFRARALQLWQVVLSKRGVLGGYQSIR